MLFCLGRFVELYMIKTRRNRLPYFTENDLKEVDCKLHDLEGLIRQHLVDLPGCLKSELRTLKWHMQVCTCPGNLDQLQKSVCNLLLASWPAASAAVLYWYFTISTLISDVIVANRHTRHRLWCNMGC